MSTTIIVNPIPQSWLEDMDLGVVAEVSVTITQHPDGVVVDKVTLRKGDLEVNILPVLSDEVVERLRIKAFAEE